MNGTDRALLGVAVLLALVALVVGLGTNDLGPPDEARVAEIAREMTVEGHWIVPQLNGRPFLEEPPLFYWLQAASYRLAGAPSAWAARLPAALAALAGAVLAAALAAGLGVHPLLAAGILATAPEYWWMARSATPDSAAALATALALTLFLVAWKSGERAPVVGAVLAAGVAFWLKSFLGMGLAVLVVVAFVALSGRGRLGWRHAALAAVGLALIVLAWLVPVASEDGGGGLSFFLLTDHVGRLLGGPEQGHVRPFLYYLPNLLLDFFPWSLVLPLALAGAWRRRTCPAQRFVLVWAAVMVGALSLSVTKRAHYLLPAYPALAVLTARWWLDATLPLDRVGRRAALVAVAVAAPLLVLGLLGLAPGPAAELFAAVERSPRAWLAFLLRLRPPAAAWGAAAVVAALAVAALRAERARPRLAAAALIACLTAVHVAITWVTLPVLNPATSIRPVAERLAALSERGVQVLAFRFRESEALSPVLFYAGRRFPAVDDVGELARRLRERPGCALLQAKAYAALPALAREFSAEPVGPGSARMVLLSAGGGCDGS